MSTLESTHAAVPQGVVPELLVRAGIDAISVSTDVVDRTRRLIAAAEQQVLLEAARG